MKMLKGWKEIAECLHLAERTAQRWEQLGLPVRRVSASSRSPIIAFSEEIEQWARSKKMKPNGRESLASFRATRLETQKLVEELRAARIEHRRLLDALYAQIARGRALTADTAWKIS
jgi:hypothetical protein